MSAEHTARLFRMEGRLTRLLTVGLLPEGVRMHNDFEGTIVDGEPAGALVRGTDEFVIRPDGIGVVDAREVVTSRAGSSTADVFGYAHPPAGMRMPPLEVLLGQDFAWPDAGSPSSAGPSTAHPRRSWPSSAALSSYTSAG